MSVAAERAWLGLVADAAAGLLTAGVRVPQEALGADALRGTTPREWLGPRVPIVQADAGLRDDLAVLAGDTTDDLGPPG